MTITSNWRSQAGTLIDCLLGVQFRRPLGSTNQVTRKLEALSEFTAALLPGANDNIIDGQHLLFPADPQVQAFIIDALVVTVTHHCHLTHEQVCAMNPAGGFAQILAHTTRLALQ